MSTTFVCFQMATRFFSARIIRRYEWIRLSAAAILTLQLWDAIIQELDQSKNVVFQWRSWDHFRITDATHEDLTAALVDYVHANALEVDNDGNILLSSRHLDEITKIDRQTGNIIWRLDGGTWPGRENPGPCR